MYVCLSKYSIIVAIHVWKEVMKSVCPNAQYPTTLWIITAVFFNLLMKYQIVNTNIANEYKTWGRAITDGVFSPAFTGDDWRQYYLTV